MRRPMARALLVTGLICSSGLSLSICDARSLQDVIVESQSRVATKLPCAFNTDIAVSLQEGQAIELDFEPDSYGVEKCIIYYYMNDQEGTIRLDMYLTDGRISTGGSRVGPTGRGRKTRRATGALCSADLEWHVDQGKALVNFRATTEPPMSEVDRIAGFVKLWSEAKFNFAFWDQVPEIDWDAVLLEYLPKVQEAKTDVEYYRVLRRCIALLRDGHTGVWGPSDEPRCRPPVEIAAVRGSAVVVQVYPAEQINQPELRAELRAARLHRGDEITHIDGRAVEQILAKDLYPYIAASTPQQRELNAYPKLAQGVFATKVAMRVRGLEGDEREVRLTRGYYDFPRKEKPFLCELPGGIIRVNLHSFGSDEVVRRFEEAYDKVLAAKGLVLDLRDNGGGSSDVGYAILKRLIDKPVERSHWKTRQYLPAFRAWGRKEQWYEGTHGTIEPFEGERYRGPVAVLTGPVTASAAEDFVVAFQTSGRGKVVGQRTLGSTGQPLHLELPGGGGARICTKWDTYPDGREFVGIGCIPDVEIIPTRADIAAGRDAVLEKAVALLREQSN